MSDAQNIQLVKDAYAAFLRGDINTILGMLDDTIDWHGVIGTEGVLPQAGRRHGRPAVAEFFRQAGESTVGCEPAIHVDDEVRCADAAAAKAKADEEAKAPGAGQLPLAPASDEAAKADEAALLEQFRAGGAPVLKAAE